MSEFQYGNVDLQKQNNLPENDDDGLKTRYILWQTFQKFGYVIFTQFSLSSNQHIEASIWT